MIELSRRRFLLATTAISTGLTALLPAPVFAADATLMKGTLTINELGEKPGLFVTSSYEFDLPNPLFEALHRGIALYFVHEFRLNKERWYWFDRTVLDRKFIVRLAFNPLTRRYRLSYNGIAQDYDTLDQVLPYIKTIRRWRVSNIQSIKNPDDYTAKIRFYLDTGKLPKPMQVTNTGRSDWTISSEWEQIPLPLDLSLFTQ